jgi:hypothetical protein
VLEADGSISTTALKDHVGTTEPTASDDTNLGYSAGSRWTKTTNGDEKEWVCCNADAGVARWVEISNTVIDARTTGVVLNSVDI